jgi:hypothetical protein
MLKAVIRVGQFNDPKSEVMLGVRSLPLVAMKLKMAVDLRREHH